MFLVSCYSLSYIWEISGCKLHPLILFSASKEANWTSKCPLHSHICLSSTLTFYSSISRCRFHLDVDSSLPRFLPVLSWRAGKRKNLDRQKQNLFQQVRDRGGLLVFPHSKHLILLFSYVQYLEMLLLPRSQTQIIAFQALSHLILTRSCKVHIICIIVIAWIVIPHLKMKQQVRHNCIFCIVIGL